MYKVIKRKNNREHRRMKIRGTLSGTTETPRVAVFRSNKYIYAQVIDDTKGITLADVSMDTKDLHKGKNKMDASFEVGKALAKKAIAKKVKKVVFDRGGYIYHGRVKSLADGARDGGLEF